MPLTLSYPGVYIDEISSGVRTVTGVSTSITAFIGRCLQGPIDEPIVINSFADFERTFGGLWLGSKLGFAVRDYYLNGGSQAIIVRVHKSENAQIILDDSVDGNNKLVLIAKINGEKGNNLQVLVTHETEATEFTLVITDLATGSSETYENLTVAPATMTARLVASHLVNYDSAASTATNRPVAGTVLVAEADKIIEKAIIALDTTTPATNQKLLLEASSPGKWANSLKVQINHQVSEEVASSLGLVIGDLFNLIVTDSKNNVLESFSNLTVKNSVRRVDNVLKDEANLVRVKSLPSNQVVPLATASVPATVSTEMDDGSELDANAIVGSQAYKTGLYALENADIFNLLCIPPYKEIEDVADTVKVIDAAILYCEKRRAFYIIDAPGSWKSKDAAKGGITPAVVGTTSKNAAIFFPRVLSPNPLRNNQIEEFAPCGMVAGVFARTDGERGIWKAPAGLEANLVGVNGLTVSLTDAETGELNPLGINCLRIMPAAGPVIWGSRTRKGNDLLASEWKYIPVRRLALYIEESLYRGTQWVVFEPNDEPLWRQISLNIDSFMNRLFRQGAFQGSTPRDAYFVKCDKETTTQDDIDRGIVNILVGFAPLKPAEFVVVKLQQIAGQTA